MVIFKLMLVAPHNWSIWPLLSGVPVEVTLDVLYCITWCCVIVFTALPGVVLCVIVFTALTGVVLCVIVFTALPGVVL